MSVTAEHYMQAMQQRFRPERAGGLRVTYRLNVTGGGGGTWSVAVADGQCRVSSGAPARADTTISMGGGEYLKLAAGQLNVQAAYQQGQIRVDGNVQHALKFVEIFAPWADLAAAIAAGSAPAAPPASPAPEPAPPEPAPQPAPESEAQSKPEPAQPAPTTPVPAKPTLAQVVQAMPAGLNAGAVGNGRFTYRFRVDGDTWTVSVADGRAVVQSGAAGSANVTIRMNGDDFRRLSRGKLDTVQGYQRGQIGVDGDINLAARITDYFRPWADAVGRTLPAEPAEPAQPAPPQPAPESPAPPVEPEPEKPPVSQPEPAPPVAPEPTPVPSPAEETRLDRLFRAMANGYRPDVAGDFDAEIEFQVLGDNGGVWTVDVHEGTCKVYKGRVFQSATLDIILTEAGLAMLSEGRLEPRSATQSGDLQVRGELNLAMRVPEIFGAWARTVDAPGTPPFAAPPAPFQLPAKVNSAAGPVFPQLVNGSFDHYQPYIRDGETRFWREFPQRYGAGWTLHHLSERKSNAARLMDSGVFGKFAQKYFHGNGHDYHIHGRHSQVLVARYGFDVALHQSVAAQPGREYTFAGRTVTFFRGPGTPPVDGKIFVSVGIDPTGGTDPTAGQVVWGGRDGSDNRWRSPEVRAAAQGDAITVFIRVENTEPDVGKTDLNSIHLENFRLG